MNYNRLSKTLPAIKGLAMLMIVNFHIWGGTKGGFLTIPEIFTRYQGAGIKGFIEGLISVVCSLGEYGVHIFIIASGFGLAASWWRKYGNDSNSKDQLAALPFWKRRLSRIFPLYWMAHGLALVIGMINLELIPRRDLFTLGIFDSLTALIASLTTLRNFSVDYNSFINSAWWYVGLAIQFYLVFPLLIRVGKRWGWSNLLLISLAVNLFYRVVIIALPLEAKLTSIYLRGALFPTRLFEFVFGIVLAISLLDNRDLRPAKSFKTSFHWIKLLVIERRFLYLNLILYVIGIAFDAAADEGYLSYKIFADVLLGVGEFSLFFHLFNSIPKLKIAFNPIGNFSYGIYLTHMNTLGLFWIWLLPWLPSYWLRFGVVSLLCCCFGALFEYLYNSLTINFIQKKVSSQTKSI